jgi:plastocyanin
MCVLMASCGNKPHKKHVVEIKSMKFQPAELVLDRGDTVTWINNDFVDHDITEEKSKAWSSSLLHPGKQWSTVIDANTDYFCSKHIVMKGKLKVN